MRQNEKLKMIKEGVIIVGIDIANRLHWVQLMLHNGILLGKPFCIKNNRNGFESLLAKLELIKQQNNCQEIIVGLEPTGHYWKALSWFLINNQIKVFLVNPFHVKTSKELDDNTQTKSDPKDAMTIGRLIKEGRFFEMYLPVGAWGELRVLSNNRNQLRAKLTAVLNNIKAILDEYFPEYETVFKILTGKASLHILTNCLFPEDLKLLGVSGIVAGFPVKKGVGLKKAGDPSRFSDWKQVRKLAGFNLIEISSGEHKGQRSISKRGRCLLRNYLYQAALVMVAQNQEFKQLYQYLISRPNPLKRKQALVVVAVKLVRVILALIQKKEFYDPSKVLGNYRETQLKKAA